MKKKNIVILAAILCVSFSWKFFQQSPEGSNIGVASCDDEENRCDQCNIYVLTAQYTNGEISKKDYEDKVKEEEKWIKKNCDACCVESCLPLGMAARQQLGEKCSCCPPPPVIGDCDCSSTTGNSRLMCIGVIDGQLEFTVHYCMNGKEIEDKKEAYLKTENLPAGAFTHPDSLRDFKFGYLFQQDLTHFSADLPFPADDISRDFWKQGGGYDKATFRGIVAAENDSVYLITPAGDGRATARSIPGLQADWFDYKKSPVGAVKTMNVLQKLSTMTMYTEGTASLLRLDEINPFAGAFSAKGQVKGKKFLYAFGYPSSESDAETYFPIRFFADHSLSGKIIGIHGYNRKLDSTIYQLLGAWLQGETTYLQALLPQSLSFDPQEAISRGACLDEMGLIREIKSGVDLSILVETNPTGQLVLYDPFLGNSIPLNAQQRELVLLGNRRHCVLTDLVLADPTLKVVAKQLKLSDSMTTEDQLVFFFKGNTRTLWSWKPAGGSPNQRSLLQSSDKFILRGTFQEAYLNALFNSGANDAEQSFFLSEAGKTTPIYLLDAFEINYPASRVILYDRSPPAYKPSFELVSGIAGRLSGQYLGTGQIEFFSIFKTDQSWEAFSQRYRQPWAYANFETELAHTAGEILQVWYGIPERVGFFKQRNPKDIDVLVKLPPDHRNVFGPANWFSIQSSIRGDGIIYVPGGAPPSPGVLFKSCLSEHWDTRLWRANPLAYFERNKN